jgi:hypothetical protein
MFSYNHAQRAVAGGKYGCRKAACAAPVFKKASTILDSIISASRALTAPPEAIPGIGCFKLRTHQDMFWALSFVLVAWLLQGLTATHESQDFKVRRAK